MTQLLTSIMVQVTRRNEQNVANQRFSAVTAQRAILPADARGGTEQVQLVLLSECASTVRASATRAVLSVRVVR